MKHGSLSGSTWLAIAALLLAPGAWAQNAFFRASPGPLNESHAEFDTSEGCVKCHDSGKGVTDAKCLDCHKPLRERLAKRQGLHATFTGACIRCHPGHKGRDLGIVDWKPVGGQQTFKHELTGFALTRGHAEVGCTACHTKRMKSGRITYLGLSTACESCHKDVHKLARPELAKQCEICHSAVGKSAKGMRLSEWLDPHRRFSDLDFKGKHREQTCVKCHPMAEMGKRVPPRNCVSCHKTTHPVPAALVNCYQCHKDGVAWKAATVDHKRFGFALLGKHQSLDCKRCHVKAAELTYDEGGCATCHQHRNAHKGQFADKACATCHVEGGKRTKPFDHDKDTRFPLLGMHAEPKVRDKCGKCHENKIYRTDKLDCANCHKDKHLGQLGNNCRKCHAVTVKFKETRKMFAKEHVKFALTGSHQDVKCETCHPNGRFRLGKLRCVDCHRKTDPHKGKLGDKCETCHIPDKGAPKFNHEKMTAFPRTGAHKTTPCSFCHRPPTDTPPKVGWTKGEAKAKVDKTFPLLGKRCADCHKDVHKGSAGTACEQCHFTSNFRRLIPGSAAAMRPADHNRAWVRSHANLPFSDDEPGAEGRSCARCHGSPACDRCHRTNAPKSHTTLWRLRGHGPAAAFDSEGCRVCHQTGTCVQCHRSSAPLNHRGAWKTVHGFAAGTFADSNCYTCHSRGDCLACHQRH
jgi:hypothetical protein